MKMENEVEALVEGFIVECTDTILDDAKHCVDCVLEKSEKMECIQKGIVKTILSYHDRWNQAADIDRALPRDLFITSFCQMHILILNDAPMSKETKLLVSAAIVDALRYANQKRGN